MIDETRAKALIARLGTLSDSQLIAIENIVGQFERAFDFRRNPQSDLVSECVLQELGDTIRIHHCFSAEAFSKDKFEYALEKVCNLCGLPAELAPRGNPGHDITVGGERFSLKTEASRAIKADLIHISKFHELGKPDWGTTEQDLAVLRDAFLEHLTHYDRILTLRRLPLPGHHSYELVEIPKGLLLEAAGGTLRRMTGSPQKPTPGYCTVTDADGQTKFQLYFDGGGEKKLQIRQIDKRLCTVHATWRFEDGKITEATVL